MSRNDKNMKPITLLQEDKSNKPKYLQVRLHANNHRFLNRIRREILLENEVNITLSRIMELSLIELRKNDEKKLKEKLIHYQNLGKNGLNEYIKNMGD